MLHFFQHTARTWPLHFGLFSTSWYSNPQFQATTTFITKIAGREMIVSDGDWFITVQLMVSVHVVMIIASGLKSL
jgi:hypothetical protein